MAASLESHTHTGLIEPGMVLSQISAADKAAVFRVAVERLSALGRTVDARSVEKALWERERSGATGLGEGYAIPHCRTDAIQLNSVVLVKLRTPLDWGAFDGQPVRTVALLALRRTDSMGEHLRILARFSRLLMQAPFRKRLEEEEDAPAICEFLASSLNLPDGTW
jgi:mannitol/fructose-specific phosphotransferase system IIA component (Ntr-type)